MLLPFSCKVKGTTEPSCFRSWPISSRWMRENRTLAKIWLASGASAANATPARRRQSARPGRRIFAWFMEMQSLAYAPQRSGVAGSTGIYGYDTPLFDQQAMDDPCGG